MAKKKAPPFLSNWQGVQILSDDLYLAYHEETKGAAQQRIWTFYEAITFQTSIFAIFPAMELIPWPDLDATDLIFNYKLLF
ncbi:MAG: hypothetical protein PF482_17380 [Desulfobacteraceae bacterium]|jgi:hypothetical protein|nr:hypothetical protein [Desulfobacteraceae bacterium]